MMIKNFILLGLILLLSGCTGLLNMGKTTVLPDKPKTAKQLQQFLGQYVQKTDKERSASCEDLLQSEQINGNLLNKLKLSFAIAVTPSCGSTYEALSLLEDARKITADEQLIKVIDYQLLVLKRLRGISRYALELKSSARESKKKAKLLKLKLDAIKSIEKALNRRD